LLKREERNAEDHLKKLSGDTEGIPQGNLNRRWSDDVQKASTRPKDEGKKPRTDEEKATKTDEKARRKTFGRCQVQRHYGEGPYQGTSHKQVRIGLARSRRWNGSQTQGRQ
jgi:hypothetical protein